MIFLFFIDIFLSFLELAISLSFLLFTCFMFLFLVTYKKLSEKKENPRRRKKLNELIE